MYLNTYELESISRQVREQRMTEASAERLLQASRVSGPSLNERVAEQLRQVRGTLGEAAQGLRLALTGSDPHIRTT